MTLQSEKMIRKESSSLPLEDIVRINELLIIGKLEVEK